MPHQKRNLHCYVLMFNNDTDDTSAMSHFGETNEQMMDTECAIVDSYMHQPNITSFLLSSSSSSSSSAAIHTITTVIPTTKHHLDSSRYTLAQLNVVAESLRNTMSGPSTGHTETDRDCGIRTVIQNG